MVETIILKGQNYRGDLLEDNFMLFNIYQNYKIINLPLSITNIELLGAHILLVVLRCKGYLLKILQNYYKIMNHFIRVVNNFTPKIMEML